MAKVKLAYSIHLRLLLTLLLTAAGTDFALAQCTAPTRIYANFQSNGNTHAGLATSSVSNPDNAVGVNSTVNNYATLNVATIAGAAESWIELKFTTATITAGTTTYVKIGGSSVSNLLGLIGGASLPVYAYSGATSAAGGVGTQIAAAKVKVSSLTATDGSVYLAITSAEAYNAVRIALNASVLVGTGQIFVYHGFYETEGVSCDPALGTATSVTGLLTLGGAVTGPNNSIDNSQTTYTTFSMGVAGVGTTLKETVYFPGPSKIGDAATVTFSIPPALLVDLSLLNDIYMTPYYGDTARTAVNLGSLLSIDLLALLRGNNIVTTSLVPTKKFDRIEISMSSLLAVIGQMNLYEVRRTPPKPTLSPLNALAQTICTGNSTTLSATTGACNELHWYTASSGGTGTIGATYNTGILTTTTTYYVSSSVIGCAGESERTPVTVTVNPLPSITPGTIADVCFGSTTAALPYTAASAGVLKYDIVWNTAGFANVTAADLPASPISLTLPNTASVGTHTGTLTLKNATTGCTQTYPLSVTVKAAPTLTSSTTASVCSGIPFSYTALSNTPGSTFSWTRAAVTGISNLAGSGSSNVVSETLTNTTFSPINVTYAFTITANGCSTTNNVIVTVNHKPGSPHITTQ